MSDGRIAIDTGLDTSGFDKGSEKLLSSILRLKQAMNQAGETMQSTFYNGFKPDSFMEQDVFDKYANNIKSSLTDVFNELTRLSASSQKSFQSMTGIEAFKSKLQGTQGTIEMLKQRLEELATVRIGSEQAWKDINAQMDAAEAKIADLKAKYEEIWARNEEKKNNGSLTKKDVLAEREADQALEQSLATYEELKATYQEMYYAIGENASAYEGLKNALDLASSSAEEMDQNIERANETLRQQRQAADELAQSQRGISGIFKSFSQAQQQGMQDAIKGIETTVLGFASKLNPITIALTAFGTVAKAAINEVKQELAHMLEQFKAIGQWAIQAPFQAIATGAQALSTGFNLVQSGAEKAISAIGKIGSVVKTAASGMKDLLAKLSLFHKQGGGVGDVATDIVRKLSSVKRMLITRVKRMFISAIFKDMQAALSAIAAKSKEFNAAMSGMKNAASDLTTNLSVTFANILNVIGPIITQIINWVTTLITYMNGFFAMISGANAIMTAKKATDSYGSSAGGAAKKAKELKKQIMGFDEINNLTDDKNDSGGGGGGAKAPQYEKKLLSELLPEDLRLWMQKIKDAIAAEDWEEVGGLIADGLNSALTKIDDAILKFRKKGVKWANIIARVLNGLVKRFNFKLLGKTIADGLNSIIAIENEFLEMFDWFALGAGLGQTINEMFADIEWEEIGKNFGLKIMAINDVLNGFLKEFNATAAGADLARAVGMMFDEIQWTGPGGIADTFSSGINSITDAVYGFLVEFEKDGARRRKEFSDALYETVTGVRWGDMIRTLHLGIKTIGLWLSSAFVGLTQGIKDVVPDISKALNEIITEDSFTEIATNVGKGIQNLVDAFLGLVMPTSENYINFQFLGEKIGNGINSWAGQIDFGTVILAVGDGFVGLLTAFTGGIATIDFVSIAKQMVDGINKLVTQNSFKFVWHNVSTGLNNIIAAFNELVGGEGSTTGGIKFEEIGQNIADNLKTLVKDTDFDVAVQAVFTGITRIFAGFNRFMANAPWREVATKFADGLKKFVRNKNIDWWQIGHDLGTAFNEAVGAIADFLEDVPWEDIKQKISTALSAIPWGEIAGNLFRIFKQQMMIKFNLVEAVAAGLMGHPTNWNFGGSGEISNKLLGLANSISSEMEDEGNKAFKESAKEMFNGFIEGVDASVEPSQEQIRQALALIMAGYTDELYDAGLDNIAETALNILDSEDGILNSNTLNDLIERMSNAGMQISGAFAEALGSGSYEDVRTAMVLLASGVEQSAIEELGLGGLLDVLTNYMNTSGKTLNEVATALATDAGTAIGEIIPTAVAAGLRDAQPLIEEAGQNASNAATQIENKEQITEDGRETGDAASTAITDAIDANKPKAQESAAGYVDIMETEFDKLPEDQKANALAMFQALGLAIDSGTAEATMAVHGAATAIVEEIKNILSANAGSSIGSTFMGGIVSGAKSGIVGVYNSMVPVGTAIGMGIVKGIRSSQSAVTVAAHNAAIAAYNAAMRAINAHSPSKLFANVGKFSMLGWAKGEDDNADAVINSIAQTTAAMEKEAEDTDIRFIDNTMLTGIDAAVDKMEEIAAVFSRVADMIASVGELPVPALAEGTVIPYQTKIDTASLDLSGVQAQMPSNALTPDNSYEVLYRAFADALRDSSGDRPIELYLNGTRVMDWIERQTRQNDRARGV